MACWLAHTESPEETRRLGELLGGLAEAGLVVLVNGDLGAGKTCLAQGVARGLGVPGATPVTSPSYSLMHIHQGRIPLYHFDLYRLTRVDDLADLGYDEFAEGSGLTLVEWADRMAAALAASLTVTITALSDNRRKFFFEALDQRGQALLERLEAHWSCHRKSSRTAPLENL